MKLYTFLIGLAVPVLSQGAIVSSVSPGVEWTPFSVSKANAVDGMDLATLSITLLDGDASSSHDLFHFFYIDDAGFDTLTVSVVSPTLDAPGAQWSGSIFFDDLGANIVAPGENIREVSSWGRETLAVYQLPGTAGNMAYEDTFDPEFRGGEFYDVSSPSYLGFRFVMNYEGLQPPDSVFYYGWVQVSTVGATTLNVEAWAYNTVPGEDILAGVIPEPGTIAFWLSAGGLALWVGSRRRGVR